MEFFLRSVDYRHLTHGKSQPRVTPLVRGRIRMQTRVCLPPKLPTLEEGWLPPKEVMVCKWGVLLYDSMKTVSLKGEPRILFACSVKNRAAQTKDINSLFPRKDTQMASKHVKGTHPH